MSDLFDRLFVKNNDYVKIPVHAFMAATTDYIAGKTTRSQIISAWSMDAEAQSDLTSLCDHIDGLSTTMDKIVFALELDAVMLLAESGLKYNTKTTFAARLGL